MIAVRWWTFVVAAAACKRDDVPAEPPDYGTTARGDSTTEQIKHALEARRKPLLATALDGARKALVAGDEFYVEFAPERKHLRDNLNKPDSMKLLREVCREVLGRDVGVRVVIKDAQCVNKTYPQFFDDLKKVLGSRDST